MNTDINYSDEFRLFEITEKMDEIEETEFHPLVDMNCLFDGLEKSMKGSSWKGEPQKFYLNFLHNLNKLRKEILNRTYKTSTGSIFKINERGHERLIHGSVTRDRTIRHVLCDHILDPRLSKFLIRNNCASQKGKGVSFQREQFELDLHNYYLKYGTNEGYIGLIDLSKFYDNIVHEKVLEAMTPYLDELSIWLLMEVLRNFEVDMSHLSDEDFATCINKKFNSIEYNLETADFKKTGEKMMKKSVDIGDQVSQNIGIFYPTPLDNYAKIVKSCRWYGRYMDDMYIICPTKEEVLEIISGMTDKAVELRLFINEKKTRICKLSDKFTFLQIKYSLNEKGRVIKRINPKAITRERRKLKAYKRLLDKGEMEYEDIKQA